jgi:hypothetical protein
LSKKEAMSKGLIGELVEVAPKTTLHTNTEGNEFHSLLNSTTPIAALLEGNSHHEEHSTG